MPEFSNSSLRDASRVVEQLFSDQPEKRFEIEKEIVIHDIELNSIEFTNDLELLADIGSKYVPAIRIADNQSVPVSLRSIIESYSSTRNIQTGLWPYYRYRSFEQLVRFMQSLNPEEQAEGPYAISHEKARTAFIDSAINFLATRITAVRNYFEGGPRNNWGQTTSLNLMQKKGGPQVNTPGCLFTVSTNSIGLRVFWSGAYYISSNYFSHPTSPASSVLQTGTYVFGVDGGAYGNVIQWDTNAVISLPGNPYVHLNY